MRAFIALELPEQFCSEIAAASRRLSVACDGRFMPCESYHLTLAFLGDICEAESELAVEALDAACTLDDGTPLGPVPLRSDGLGKFGKPQDATLWMGVYPAPELLELAERVRGELVARGIAFDEKPFKPHVTIARRARLPRGNLPLIDFPLPDEATRVTLFKSTLTSDGAVYKPLYQVELGDWGRDETGKREAE